MASTHRSPVMVEQSSSPPTLSYASPEYALSILSPSASNEPTHQPASTATMPEPQDQPVTINEQNSADIPAQNQSRSQAQAAEEQAATSVNTNDGDDSSNSESNSESSTSTETPGTISTPRSSAYDSGHPVPDSGSTQLDRNNAEESPTEHNENAHSDERDLESPNEPGADDTPSMPPPPNGIDVSVPDNIPSWVQYEEDTSAPDEAEIREIEAHGHELSAADTTAIEKDVFTEIDDPDIRPCKKIRLSWVVKGVRGTRERPNRARIMTSPAVCIDGMYWNLKFFPRGNKSRSSLSAYVRCSPLEPTPNKDDLVGSFKCYEAAPDADLAKTEPILNLELKLPDVQEEGPPPPEPQAPIENNQSSEDSLEARRRNDQDDDESISGDEDDLPESSVRATPIDDYRVSAQLGLVIYNPAEPRTCHTSSASHQFYPHQDDWGWDTAASHWDDIHRRKRGQRQALLRDDTLAIDAYVRIYDDPTKALFWHSSPGETQWDSKGLAGVFPMGTRLLYHSPATAGITAWSLLAPFRAAIQSIDAGRWRKDSSARPTPLTAHLQLVMFQMRNMKKEELYIHIDGVIHEITRSGESFDNVNTFWDAFRRSIEIEVTGDNTSLEALNDIFGTRELSRSLPKLPVQDVHDFQEAATRGFTKANLKAALPNFLPLTLDRQSFDTEKRQWQLRHDRVRISEEIDLSTFCTHGDGKYSLYGLVVHDGDRTSGKFFSVLRPTGPGGKWLMFSDGNGNKVFSYTKKRIQEYEGLVGADLRKVTSNRQTIQMALYIRTSRISEYLRKEVEPYKLPIWLKQHLDGTYHHDPDLFEPAEDDKNKDSPVPIEIFRDKSVSGQEGKLDLYKLKTSAKARQPEYRQQLTADRDATVRTVRDRIAETLEIDQKAFKLWAMNYHRLGGVSKGYMYVLPNDAVISSSLNTSQYLSLWLTTVPGEVELEEDVLSKRFIEIGGAHVKAPPKPEPVVEEPAQALAESNEEPTTSEPRASDESTEATEPNNNEAAPDDEQVSVQEAVAQSTQATTVTRPTYSSSAETGQSRTEQAEESAVPDAEQASVSEAVEQSIENAASNHPSATAEVVEIEPSDTTSQAHSSPAPEAVIGANSNASSEPTTAEASNAVAESEEFTSTSDGDGLVQPLISSEPQPTAPQPVTPSEPGTALDVPIARASHGASDGSVLPPVVHGHLFEASSHADHPLSHGEPPLPVGIPIAYGDGQIVLVQPSQGDDISAQDAALISSMIAADLEAVERAEGEVVDVEADDHREGHEDEVESEAADEAVDSRPTTPRPRVVDVYGFLHIFDAEAQKLSAHGTFTVPRDTVISSMVRKEMGFNEEKTFHLWKRDGTYRTVGVSLESTFQDVSLTDCCEVIVGDDLGESKMEALKSEAKYIDPGQLMRYLAMVQRGHPIACTTTEGAIEINEFGGDYYKGPLVRGQRHGPCCQVITQSGDMYEGPLVAGQKSGGLGGMTYQNGDTYSGEWLDDMKHGQGEFMEKRTGNRYVGGYENDKRWGKGVTYWEQADQQASLCQVCYFEEVDALFYRCGHVVACYACARQCASEGGGCPVCRKPIESVVKMYRS